MNLFLYERQCEAACHLYPDTYSQILTLRTVFGGHVHVNSYTYKPVAMCIMTWNINFKHTCDTHFEDPVAPYVL